MWIGVCLAFIFGALLEFALVNYAARKDMIKESRRRRTHQGAFARGGLINYDGKILNTLMM